MRQENKGEMQIFQTNEGKITINVNIQNETVLLTQEQIATLFGVNRPAITKHIGNIFKSGELDKNSVCSKMDHTANDGKNYEQQFYNLDAILSVGYRVNSKQVSLFRMWSNKVYQIKY